jgi:two-component system, chemotaxis family, protein-glutamate methylesterase/glutaminase
LANRDIFVVGASAGGVEALTQLCGKLPADLPASVFVVQHISPSSPSYLPQLLSRAGKLPAETAVDGQEIQPGRIYVAPPDLHLLLRPDRVLLRRGPPENRTRPAIDVLFRSAAVAYGPRVVGVVLTGLLDDGTEGLIAIKRAGGTSVVQDPADAAWPSMPQHALMRDHVDHCLALAQLPELLVGLSTTAAGPPSVLPPEMIAEDQIAAYEFAVMNMKLIPPGRHSLLSCPSCGGVLNQIEDEETVRFRCQIGHAFTGVGLEAAQNDEVERALAVAVRTHRDRINLFRQMEEAARARKLSHAAERWQRAGAEAKRFAELLEHTIAMLRRPADPEV